MLWNEDGVPENQLTQVWFAGVHSNVGGGYPDDFAGADSAVLDHAGGAGEERSCGSRKASASIPDVPQTHRDRPRDKDGRLYDSRSGLGGYYRYGPRKLVDLCNMRFSANAGDEVKIDIDRVKIHRSVIARAKSGAHEYAPIGIPENYLLVSDDGIEPQDAAGIAAAGQRPLRGPGSDLEHRLATADRVFPDRVHHDLSGGLSAAQRGAGFGGVFDALDDGIAACSA